jgi:hypothetical protein
VSEALQTTWMRDALAWFNGPRKQEPASEDDKPVYKWLWEAIQGDFNDDRSTGQIAFDAGISMIPLVDQVCDVRDLIANCNKLYREPKDGGAWLGLALTLIGLFPTLGSLVKGVLKIILLFIRKYGLDHVMKALDEAMTWVITFLRKRNVQKYLKELHVDDVFGWLAKQVKEVKAKVTLGALLASFDRGIAVLRELVRKVDWMPGVADKAKATLQRVEAVRKVADQHLGQMVKPLQDLLDRIVMRFEAEAITYRAAVHNVNNVHFRGTLPEASAVALMQRRKPNWLTKDGTADFLEPLKRTDKDVVAQVTAAVANGYPDILKTKHVQTFAAIKAKEIKGPAKLYRIVSPASMGASHCWVSEEVFMKLMKEADPKAAWRKYLAVWPHWNADGQYVVYEVKKGETLKVWEGPAASQRNIKGQGGAEHTLEGYFLEGGWKQIVFYPHTPPGGKPFSLGDQTRYYKRRGAGGNLSDKYISYAEWDALPSLKNADYEGVRVQINEPHIRGPFDTGWGMTDFDAQLHHTKLGLPALPGQTTNR